MPSAMPPELLPPSTQVSSLKAWWVFDQALIGMALVRDDGCIVRVNDALCRLLGRSAEVLCAARFQDVLHPNDALAEQALREQLAAGAVTHRDIEVRCMAATGLPLQTRLHGSLAGEEGGQVLWQVQPVLSRRDDAGRLRRSEQRFRGVFQENFQFMVLLSPEGRVLDLNRGIDDAGADIHAVNDPDSVTRDAMVGQYFWNTVWWRDLPEMRAIWPQRLRAAAKAHAPVLSEDLYNRSNGELRIAQVAITAIRDAGGVVDFFVVQATDITDRKRAEAEIVRLNAGLEARVRERTAQLRIANKELESFSYSIAHDLRGPLSAIDGFSYLLEEAMLGDAGEKPRHYLARIRAGVRQMGDLTDALLSLAHVSRVPLQSATVDLGGIAQEVLQQCRERDPGRAAEVSVQPDLLVQGDPRLLRQVMTNLLGNAWKFTALQPLARIVVARQAWADGATVFCVRDNGVGFDMAYAEKLFGAFQRLHSPREFAGTGIGLANVHRIVTRHGGRIWAESSPGQGASFYFRLGSEAQEGSQGTETDR